MIIACSFEEDKLCSTVYLVIQRGSFPVAGPGSVQLCLDEVAVLGRPRVYALSTSLLARDHVLPTIDPRYLYPTHYAHLSIHLYGQLCSHLFSSFALCPHLCWPLPTFVRFLEILFKCLANLCASASTCVHLTMC